jgi:hypothetical protein
MVPNKEIAGVSENKADNKKTKDIENPETKSQDLGKTIFPSRNLAIAQKTTHRAKPETKSNPFPASTGIFVKGKKKIGNNTITKNNTKNESLSNMFELISKLYYRLIM